MSDHRVLPPAPLHMAYPGSDTESHLLRGQPRGSPGPNAASCLMGPGTLSIPFHKATIVAYGLVFLPLSSTLEAFLAFNIKWCKHEINYI